MHTQKRIKIGTARGVALLTVFASILFAPRIASACMSTYLDAGLDASGTNVVATAYVTDYFNEEGCAPWYWGAFTHTYTASATITSPQQQRQAVAFEINSQSMGGGDAYVNPSLATNGEVGVFNTLLGVMIDCSVENEILNQQVQEQDEVFCPDNVRDQIVREYEPASNGGVYALGVSPAPMCGDIQNHSPTFQYSPNFTWAELNGCFEQGNPYSPYGWVQSAMDGGLEATRSIFGGPIIICGASAHGSGYRAPSGNQAVSGESDSYHMQGRAADMWDASITPYSSWTVAEFTILRNAAAATGADTTGYNQYPDDRHLHVEWEY